MTSAQQTQANVRLWQGAFWLAVFTILYNFGEGVISVAFGLQDESLALFGFGVDSFIEMISGLGIMSMVLRIQRSPVSERSRFERTALRVTGTAFYVLAAGLVVTALYNLAAAHTPVTTLPGTIISAVSIGVMWLLVLGKRRVGLALSCSPILADANCTLVCIYMSVVLMISSLIYELTGFGFIDSLGAFGLVYFSVNEGRESFEKARGMEEAAVGEG
jgi:divalent metal cation (Fe/Co/Zn/Cd) transporter